MKTIRLRGPAALENLNLVDEPDPGQPGPGEIRVRVYANSLNYHDYRVVTGLSHGTHDGRIVLSDGAGVVEAAGEGVSEFKVGDHVVSCFLPDWQDGEPMTASFATVPGDGVDGFAREVVVRPAHWFTHAPRGYTHAEAATLPVAALTAWRALAVNGDLKAGDSVLVMGTGGVSIFALQFAKAMGATVIATSSSHEKIQRLKRLGASQAINYKEQAEWGQAVLDVTGGKGVDHVVEIGGPSTLPQSLNAARIGGHVALIGTLTGRSGDVPTALLMRKRIRLIGVLTGSHKNQIDMVRAIDATGLKPVVDRSFPLADIADAFRYQESGRHFGKICLEV